MADEKPETPAERDERVRLAEEERAERAEKAPVTGVLSLHDVLRHLIHHGPARSDAERAELLAVVDTDEKPAAEPQPEPPEDEPAAGLTPAERLTGLMTGITQKKEATP